MTRRRWWWLSFGSEVDGRFLGVAIVRGTDIIDAARAAHALGCNPGGQVLAVPVRRPGRITADFRERLLSRSEAEWLADQVEVLR